MADLGTIGTINKQSAVSPGFTISGIVTGASGVPASRQVLIIKRGDPTEIEKRTNSSASTGEYKVMLPDAGERCVLFLGANGGTENAIVFDRVIPL